MHANLRRRAVSTPTSRRVLLQGSAALALSHNFDLGTEQGATPEARPITIGWSTIYLAPAWTTQTGQLIAAEIDRLRGLGIAIDYTVFDASGDTATQESHLRTMIDRELDICLLIAGSADDLNAVVADAHRAGVLVVNFDSLVTTEQLTATVFEDQVAWGRMTAGWLVDELGGSGAILTVNGPAGLALSDQRAAGAREVFEASPGIEIAATVHIPYDEATALAELEPLIREHPGLAGIWCGEGAHASAALTAVRRHGTGLVPIAGENYNGFLRQWRDLRDEGFRGYATAELNWMALVALRIALKARNGEPVPASVRLDLPEITNETVALWADDDQPDAWYPMRHIPSPAEIDRIIAEALAAGTSIAPSPGG